MKLKTGSHTEANARDCGEGCVNEVALVAAGIPYQQVACPDSIPFEFSPGIATLLLLLNDHLYDDDNREKLWRFVPILNGTRDNPDIEQARLNFVSLSLSKLYAALSNMNGYPEYNPDNPDNIFHYQISPIIVVCPEALDTVLDILESALRMGNFPGPISQELIEQRFRDFCNS